MNPTKIGNSESDEPNSDVDSESTLIYQEFIVDPDITVQQVLKDNEMEILDFARFQMGESIETTQSLDSVETCGWSCKRSLIITIYPPKHSSRALQNCYLSDFFVTLNEMYLKPLNGPANYNVYTFNKWKIQKIYKVCDFQQVYFCIHCKN